MRELSGIVSVVLWIALATGCDSVEVGAPRGAPPVEPGLPGPIEPEMPAPGDAPCETLDRAGCLASLVCTLVAPERARSNRYVCRPARGNCEAGIRQVPADADRCAARTGCVVVPASCYCPCRGSGRTAVEDRPGTEACDCDCGGGPPRRCAPRPG